MRLVDDLLELTRLESEAVAPQPETVPLSLVAEVAASFAARARASGLEVRCDISGDLPPLSANASHLRSVLERLLDNAIKFAESGDVWVRVTPTSDGCRPKSLEIQNVGSGIAPERIETIFEPFQQGEDFLNRRRGGSGLGLHLARRQCEAMGFSLNATSTLGVGSIFIIDFGTEDRQREAAGGSGREGVTA